MFTIRPFLRKSDAFTCPTELKKRTYNLFSPFFFSSFLIGEKKKNIPFFTIPLSSPVICQSHYYSAPQFNQPVDLRVSPSSSPSSRFWVDSNNLSLVDYASLIQSCVSHRAIEPGKQIHAQLCLSGRGSNEYLGTKLVNLYSNCNALSYAHRLFDRIPKRNLFLWNVLIRGYAWDGPYKYALSLYFQMLDHGGMEPDNFTFPFVLKACSMLSAVEQGREIHEHVIRTGWDKDVFVGAALIDMYAKCGCVEDARQVFDKITMKDVVCWNSMLAAYAQNGHADESFALSREMAFSGVRPAVATLVTIISSSADVAALPHGREIHGYSWRQGFDSLDKVKTALVDMYAKSGSLRVARSLFERLQEKRVVSWNAIINGYAMHGHAFDAIELFEEMRYQNAQPDHITFVGVLSACRHGRLLDQGWKYFDQMQGEFRIDPTVQHYTCMVDLLGHCGRFSEAYNLIMQMKVKPDSGVWGSLLNACKIHANVELAELALDRLVELEPNDSGNYVILSNIYAQVGNWEGVAKVRRMMMDKGVKKSIACSWVEAKGKVHAFLSGDTSHPSSHAIYAELERVTGLITEAGYVPNTGSVFHDVEDDEKTRMVSCHSERLAVAFGLISTAPGTRLLITKNLRACEDCHGAIKFISEVTQREIIIRDVNRYHRFQEGSCSCGDYW